MSFFIRTISVSFVLLVLLIIILSTPITAIAATDSVFGGLDATADEVKEIRNGMVNATKAGSDSASTHFTKKIGGMVGAVLAFIGVIFLLLTIYGGLMWMTAAGNDQQVEKARKVLIASIIGLIIVLAAYAITSFIGNKLTS